IFNQEVEQTTVTGGHSTVADFDNDGDLDFAVTDTTESTIGIHKNDGSGNFSSVTLFPASTPATITHGDIDNDGDMDIATGGYNGGVATVYINNGSGAFNSATNYSAGT